MSTSNWIGPGIGYRRLYYDELISDSNQNLSLVLEILPDHFFTAPDRIKPLAEKYPIVFHDVAMSVSTMDSPEFTVNRLKRIRRLADMCAPVLFSDHLAITRSPDGLDLGHLGPAWYTEESLQHIIARIRLWQDLLELPIALENIAQPFLLDSEMSEPDFFRQLVEETNCGVLMDLTNLLYNARNFGREPAELLKEYPLGAVKQVHLAGGRVQNDWWVDSHSEDVEGASYDLLRSLPDCGELRTIVVERDENAPSLAELVEEAKRGANIWLGRRGND